MKNPLQTWNFLSPLPLGKQIFSWGLAFKVPYTYSIRPKIIEMSRGHIKLQMKDKRRHRNHLHSLHAVALMNAAEAASGLAVITTLDDHLRAILTKFEIQFIKKARGTIVAEASFDGAERELTASRTYEVKALLRDAAQHIVAEAKATWLVGPSSKALPH